MDIASDKKPLLSSNSSHASDEGSNKVYTDSQSKKTEKEEPSDFTTAGAATSAVAAAADPKQQRVVRPTAQARPFSSTTKGFYWVFTILHLIVLLIVLFGISFGLIQFVFSQVSEGPLYWGTGSFIGGVPSVMYEPVNKLEKRRIRFCPNQSSTFKPFVDRLKEVSPFSPNKNKHPGISCDSNREFGWSGSKTNGHCDIDAMAVLHKFANNDTISREMPYDMECDPSSTHMGYSMSTPCILIRLTRILGFYPMNDQQKADEKKPKGNSCNEMIEFDCTATTSDRAVVGLLKPAGIPFCTFPFWNEKDFITPFYMIRPNQSLPVGETKIVCKPNLRSLAELSNGKENKLEIIVEIEEGEEDEEVKTERLKREKEEREKMGTTEESSKMDGTTESGTTTEGSTVEKKKEEMTTSKNEENTTVEMKKNEGNTTGIEDNKKSSGEVKKNNETSTVESKEENSTLKSNEIEGSSTVNSTGVDKK